MFGEKQGDKFDRSGHKEQQHSHFEYNGSFLRAVVALLLRINAL